MAVRTAQVDLHSCGNMTYIIKYIIQLELMTSRRTGHIIGLTEALKEAAHT